MTGFRNVAEVADAEIAGRTFYRTYRKLPSVITVAGSWYDYSMSPGNPKPQYYASAPLVGQTMGRFADGGLDHGQSVSPASKYLRKLTAVSSAAAGVPQRLYLLDYLMYYPFIDMGDSSSQLTDNTETLPRYTDGKGVQMMAVLVAPHGLVGDTILVSYTNQDGVAGRLSIGIMNTASTVNGTILTSQTAGVGRTGPFFPLQAPDTGVRSIESVLNSGNDVGLYTMVLVKPLAELTIRGIDAPTEKDFLLESGMKMPQIQDDAYLNFISCPNGSLAGVPMFGDVTFTWN